MNWNLPSFESQYSNHVDVEDCVEESFCHIIFSLTGIRYSPRALAKLVGVTTNGSSIQDCINAVNKYGLIPYDLWPTPDSFTWEEYYAPIPLEVLNQAHPYTVKLIDPDLNKSPLWTQLSFPNPNGSLLHWVEQFNSTQYFDSEPGGAIKPLNHNNAVVLSQYSIQIIKGQNLMPQIKTQQKGEELRVVLQAANITEYNSLCAVFGHSTQVDEQVVDK